MGKSRIFLMLLSSNSTLLLLFSLWSPQRDEGHPPASAVFDIGCKKHGGGGGHGKLFAHIIPTVGSFC